MPVATKKATTTRGPEKAAYAVLDVLEKAGKEITHLAREGRKRVRDYERKTTPAPRKSGKA